MDATTLLDKMDSEFILLVLMCIGVAMIILFLAWLYIFLPIGMAAKRGRSRLAALLIFWFMTPIVGIILLVLIGDAPKKEQDVQ